MRADATDPSPSTHAHATAIGAAVFGIAVVAGVIDACSSTRTRESRDATAKYFGFIGNAAASFAVRPGGTANQRALILRYALGMRWSSLHDAHGARWTQRDRTLIDFEFFSVALDIV
jgi:hypothetical protein